MACGFDILGGKDGNLCQAEHKGLRRTFGQPENFCQIFAGFFGAMRAAAQFGVQLPRAFNVNGKKVYQTFIQQRFDNVGTHTVGIKLYAHAKLAQVAQYCIKFRHKCGFAAGYNYSVDPFYAVFKKTHDAVFADRCDLIRAPCHGEIVACGAVHIAAAHKDNAGIVAGPVTQADAFKSTHIGPCRIHNKQASFCNLAQRYTG